MRDREERGRRRRPISVGPWWAGIYSRAHSLAQRESAIPAATLGSEGRRPGAGGRSKGSRRAAEALRGRGQQVLRLLGVRAASSAPRRAAAQAPDGQGRSQEIDLFRC